MKAGRSAGAIAKAIKRDLAFAPGPSKVTRTQIRKAVQAVIKSRLEKERGAPVALAELKRDPKLPAVQDPTVRSKSARARIRKAVSAVVPER